MTNSSTESVEVTQAEAISFLESGFRNVELPPLDRDDIEDIRRALNDIARHRQSSIPNEVVKALEAADGAIREMFRYFDGGETRGSYDGKPERAQLRKAGYRTTAALASLKERNQ